VVVLLLEAGFVHVAVGVLLAIVVVRMRVLDVLMVVARVGVLVRRALVLMLVLVRGVVGVVGHQAAP